MSKLFWPLLTAALLLSGPALRAQTTPAPAAKAPAPPSFNQPVRLVVAADGTGDYRTVQEAVMAVRDFMQVEAVIFLKNGTYREKLLIPSQKTHITLLGESQQGVVISWSDYSGDAEKHTTYTSSTVRVQGNDFRAENLTIENAAGPVGQAVALHVEGDRAQVRNCRLLGHQDTLFLAQDNSRQLYQDCYIEGTTDFIFGAATAVFERCVIHSKSNSYVTAASTTPRQAFGLVFLHCRLTAAPAATTVYLGRPWRPHARTVFIGCELGAHIRPEGWHNWGQPDNEKTAYYAEYHSTGPGAPTGQRAAWSRQLTRREARQYTTQKVFGDWNPTPAR
ncbi:pectinesterase family protein [Hymenobacter sp. 15J16-1T3B]|uniref:pectinesterase family protein n=1 Tax=Hymenobacter sp. 15J16-1T3B TaxID=2886941 RepID=UPI001D1254C0|nr:pectinesterase family protein [Hymenobacter sp. 15J16-1T3B]MCC3157487.1 pectinesterase family protein [Hymenobacter sp. 15J16-1T3B]